MLKRRVSTPRILKKSLIILMTCGLTLMYTLSSQHLRAQGLVQSIECKSSSPQDQRVQRDGSVLGDIPACLGVGETHPHYGGKMTLKPDQIDAKILSPRGALNVLHTPLKLCCSDPLTGYERDGFCHTGVHDRGKHTVCAVMTEEFLSYTKSRGNDLSTPHPQYGFPGLKSGDRWCLCALRWAEAEREGYAPPIDLESTHIKTLDDVPLELLKRYELKSTP